MTRKKPDYTQFMKSPAPLSMASPSDKEDRPPMSAPAPNNPQSADDIPWGEVILDADPGKQRKPEASPVQMSKVPASSSPPTAVSPHQPPLSPRERVLARTAPVAAEDPIRRSDSPELAATLDDFAPRGYPPIAVLAIGLAMVLLLFFLTGRN